jgi:putative hemolysin
MHFDIRNSTLFYALSLVHPLLKTLMLPRQLLAKSGATIGVKIGRPITAEKWRRLKSSIEKAEFLRLKTYLLGDTAVPPPPALTAIGSGPRAGMQETIMEPVAFEFLEAEIRNLPKQQALTNSGDMVVFYANAGQIPWTMREIGRQRELAFRAVGEGTGKSLDIDIFDGYYLHLFIWDYAAGRIAGAYRLGLADEIVSRHGKAGLYSHSLFKYKRSFINELNPSIELGRSFVAPDYQRSYAPLLLLWKGIAEFVARHPKYAMLFGPVSISNNYSSLAKQLLIQFLKQNNFDTKRGRRVRARKPYRPRSLAILRQAKLNGFNSIEELSDLVADVESDEKGAPILIRQYLKLGGRMLGFNIDHAFGDCIDGLILVDLRETDPQVLQRYMGRDNTRRFFAFHTTDELVAASDKVA